MGRGFSVKDFKRGIAELGSQLQDLIEAKVMGFDPDPVKSAKRREKALDDLEYFARTYFPHYVTYANSVVHDWLYAELPKVIADKKGRRKATAAPRGEAKSTIVSQIFVLWCVAKGAKHFIPIVMDAFEQAAMMIEAIRAELEWNPRLRTDFPEVCGEGRIWREGLLITRSDVKIQGFGSGKRMRGLRHGPFRPDLVICDDLENDENVQTPEQRDKLERWFRKTVLSLGPPDGSLDVLVIGTILHYDSVLSRLLKDPLWESQTFQAVIEWPDRLDLWDRWEELLLNEGPESASLFYVKHKREMERGAVVSWPAARPLRDLMEKRARDGHAAFDSEQQNDPISDEDALFSNITFWVERLRDWVFVGACDPSLGKEGKSRDPSAILVGGFSRERGKLDVVEAAICKRVPDKLIADVIAMQKEYRCVVWGFESVQFQEFLRQMLIRESIRRGVPVPTKPVVPHTDKLLRIQGIQPFVVNGDIRLHPAQKVLIQQLRHFPKADHDDGPDALEMLWQLATKGLVQYRYEGVRTGASRIRKQKGAF